MLLVESRDLVEHLRALSMDIVVYHFLKPAQIARSQAHPADVKMLQFSGEVDVLGMCGLPCGAGLALANPVLDLSQQPIGSAAVAGPTYRLTLERMIEIGPAVVAATREIARELEMTAVLAEPSAAERIARR